jgi:CheY-like chemotaxis protein
VEQSGGSVTVETELGRGTTFRIYLPQVEASAPAAPAAAPAARPAPAAAPPAPAPEPVRAAVAPLEPAIVSEVVPQRAETILLVEDALRVRAVVREILEMNGYNILEARHGVEALEISERHRGPIHLMVTDVVMPQMSGRELAQRLQPVRPDMKVLYMSGYTDDAIVRHGVLGAGIAFLSKPFTPDALALKVREVLDTEPRNVDPTAPLASPPANGNGPVPEAAVSAAAGPVVQRAEDVGTTRPSRV